MQELVEMGHDSDRVAFGMERLISDIQITGGKGAKCDSMAVRPTVDPTDVPLRRVAERVYEPGEKRPSEIIDEDLREVLACYMQELVEMGHDSDRIAFGMERLISDIQITGGKGAKCDSMAVRPTVDPTDVPLRRVAERELTDAEKEEKEDIVKGMKKSKKDFKKRYGKDAESVMYGAATNIAKKNRGGK